MKDAPWPLKLGKQSPLLLTVPAPMKVDTNSSPSKEAIQKFMTRMDNGVEKKRQQSQLLVFQHPSAKISMDLQTSKQVKDYIQHFAHPAICQN
ncbi:hypothetical protein DSO57_1031336 [Entomophthora muscae]|uniref:Uncharacterized protein n=1 Tax=Entomophthora muscae TaxID=34485 RepID=A0ACC2UAW1_9FUNG|nr:hypothetical protein DSO57_1031336 [Entomophthora muscae]